MNLNEHRGNAVEELNPGMKLLLMVMVSICTLIAVDDFVLLLHYILIIVLFFASKLYLKGIRIIAYITIVLLIEKMGGTIRNVQSLDIFRMIIHFLKRFSVLIIMGIWMASKIRVGDFVSCLKNMRMPTGITITIAVALRYLPTIKQEFHYIKNAMKMRGLGPSPRNIITHPLRMIEYYLVPLVIRCFTIADELSASVMTRGLDLEIERVPYHEVRIRISDVLITLVFTVGLLCVHIWRMWVF